ncbi:unnamed protein product [Triticum turgidum subsp. durum]|uniref:Protein TILLER ANGLE CONTROL 1 n=1 Tax=Triticum turgidum subsp. durum TaxID=4567 RepID=A0A9R0TWB0_TRITD|nr:unnamed protein product [Triticum turgidum subsp. durum]
MLLMSYVFLWHHQVFSWLNRKMHSNAEYCTIDDNKAMEKEDSVRACASVAEQDTEALLLRDVLLNGILAIGTLGHNMNSPEARHEQDEFIVMDEEKVDQEKYEEEKCEDKEEAFATAPSAPEPAIEPARMHSSSMKEYNFTCSVKEEILMCEVEVEDISKIQEQPLLMAEKVEKVRTTLADLFAAETFSPSDTGEKSHQKTVIIAGASTSKPTLCMEKTHKKKPIKPMPDPLKATRKLSRVWLSSSLSFMCCNYAHFMKTLPLVLLQIHVSLSCYTACYLPRSGSNSPLYSMDTTVFYILLMFFHRKVSFMQLSLS